MTLHAKMKMTNSQWCPLKPCRLKHELDMNVYDLKKKFIWGFSTKAICAFLLQENILKLLELNIWRNDHIFQIIDQIKCSKVPFKPLHGGLFKISLTVLFNIFHFYV